MQTNIISSIKRRLQLMIARAVVKAVSDSGDLQTLQVSLFEGELRDKLVRFQNYGFTSHPHPEAEAVTLFSAGSRDSGLVIAVDDRRYRIKSLKQGEVAIYTDEGDSIILKRDRKINISTMSFTVNSGTCKISNGSDDLISLLSKLVEEIIDAKTATLAGAQPLIGKGFSELKQKIDKFMEK